MAIDRSSRNGFARVVFLTLVTSVTSIGATAQTIDDRTTCAATRAILDAPQPDTRQMWAVVEYVASALSTIDHLYATKGGPEIIRRMSDEGRASTIAMVTMRCGDHPDETLQASAIAVYEGLRAMGQELGVDPPDENAPDATDAWQSAALARHHD
jgi:hypothetical protein